MRTPPTEQYGYANEPFDSAATSTRLNKLIDLTAIDKELDKIEREYRLSFMFVGLIGVCLFGILLATM